MASQVPVDEQTIWRGSPSQWLNFGFFLVSGAIVLVLVAGLTVLSSAGPSALGGNQGPAMVALGVLLVAVLAIAFKRYLDVRCRHYEITTDRVRLTTGILSKRTDGLELYRVDDTHLLEPVLLRLVRKGSIELVTSDRTTPNMLIEAVPEPKWLWNEIRRAVEACRDRKRTRVIDFVEDGDQ